MYFFTYQCYIFSGSQKNERRYNLEVGCGYGIPFFISLLTIIVEFSADKCFPIKPRFGDEKCFFAGKNPFAIMHKKVQKIMHNLSSQENLRKESGFTYPLESCF